MNLFRRIFHRHKWVYTTRYVDIFHIKNFPVKERQCSECPKFQRWVGPVRSGANSWRWEDRIPLKPH